MPTYYVTTPIYYVNDRPHIGHCYTTLVADVAARMRRLAGDDVFFLTGTDEHAEKVSKAAQERGLSPMDWATQNAERFKGAFRFMNFSNDDFVRTTEERHKTRASAYIQRLVDSGDIELGDYEGWFDPSQEEYVTETAAKESDFKSPVTGRPLEKRVEQNYFFRLDKYSDWLKGEIEGGRIRVLPEARRNEVLSRITQGLQKVPVSRRIKVEDADWGIRMPNDAEHRIYVWIEALCNYLTVVDEPERRRFWPDSHPAGASDSSESHPSGVRGESLSESRPPDARGDSPESRPPDASIVHFMAKDILWFHAVIWPAMLHALGERPPTTVYAHAYFISEGRKMSKSLGNFIEIDLLQAYAKRYSLDAVRWYLATQGPLGSNDADFAYSRFVEVYNADLANGIGNAVSRVGNMIGKYFGGAVPDPKGCASLDLLESASITKQVEDQIGEGNFAKGLHKYDWPELIGEQIGAFDSKSRASDLGESVALGLRLSDLVDGFIGQTRPFTIAKHIDGDEVFPGLPNGEALAAILYQCAEALRVATLLLYPAMPEKMAEVWRNWNCDHLNDPADANSGFRAPLRELAEWGGRFSLKPGQKIEKGEALFMRADVKEAAPEA